MSNARAISGFPEWLPADRMVEQRWLDALRDWFERCGFSPIETRAVEPVEVLVGQGGDADKEVYGLRRLQAEGEDREALGLHFDLTVPFARYVVQNRGKLRFPFKRYQIQKVWRGERPQAGRYREFYQADIDVIADGELPLHFDAEMPRLLLGALDRLPGCPAVRLLVNSRKLMEGAYRGLGIDAPEAVTAVLRVVDKLDKIGPEAVARLLVDETGLTQVTAEACLKLAEIRSADPGEVADRVRGLRAGSELLDEGLDDLATVVRLADLPPERLVADLRIARGLDYYTGTVYEGIVPAFEESDDPKQRLGTVCSGGRYENLASAISKKARFPGVGVSIGVSRLLGRLLSDGAIRASRATPTCVLIALPSEDRRPAADAVARQLRDRGIPAEVFHRPQAFGKQIKAADKQGIPFVWFLGDPGSPDEVKDIRSGGQQVAADSETWMPPADDLIVRILTA